MSKLRTTLAGFGLACLCAAGTGLPAGAADEGSAATSTRTVTLSCTTSDASGSSTSQTSVPVSFTGPTSVAPGATFPVTVSVEMAVPASTTFGGAGVSQYSPAVLNGLRFITAVPGSPSISATMNVTATGPVGSVARVRLTSVTLMRSSSTGFASTACGAVGDATIGTVAIGSTNRAPDCSSVAPSTSSLWDPDHTLRDVTVGGATDPDGDPVALQVTGVHQDEAVDGSGDGNSGADAALTSDPATVQLRSERSGRGDGRVYVVSYSASDGKGGSCAGEVTVSVPKSRGKAAVDSGARFDSTAAA